MEEREKERELRDEVKEKNERRTETGKKKFYWRVLDMKLRKWYIWETIETQQQTVEAQEEEESLL